MPQGIHRHGGINGKLAELENAPFKGGVRNNTAERRNTYNCQFDPGISYYQKRIYVFYILSRRIKIYT